MQQRLFYLPVLALSFVMFGVFWWSILFVSDNRYPYDLVAGARLLFSYALHVAVIGLATGGSLRDTAILSTKLHALILGPALVIDWLSVWNVAFWHSLDGTEALALDANRVAATLILWWAYSTWLTNKHVLGATLGIGAKIVFLFILPLITQFFIAVTPILFMGAGDL